MYLDGQGTRPWEPDDPVVEPLNVYGHSKYEGEVAVEKYAPHYYIVRIAWVFGLNGKNFIKTMLNLGKTHDTLTVVDDQIGTPTYTYDLARLLVDMLEKEEYGKYHATNEGGYISWCDFAKEIFRQAGMDVKVIPVSSAEYPAKAKRPSTAVWKRKNWKSMDLSVFRTGKMHWDVISKKLCKRKAAAVTDSCFLCAVAHVFVLIKIYQFRFCNF